MTTPKPRLDLFNDSARLVSKKCRTSTPLLRPPKPPMKSAKNNRRLRAHQEPQMIPRLFRQFEVIAKIGSGDFGDVYEAKSHLDGQYYAIKKTSMPFTSNSDRLRKLQEVRTHQMLPPHPNCVRYYDSWEEDGYLYIQTELCKTSLNALLEQSDEHKLPERLIWNYLHDLLMAVKHLHDHDLIHMDIKPDNIFISFDGTAKLGDFGLMCSCLDLNSSALSNSSSSVFSSKNMEDDEDTIEYDESFLFDTPSFTDQHHDQDTEMQHLSATTDINDSGMINISIINRSEESIDSIDEGDSKYLASETMQGKFTKAADIFSLGISLFEVASGLELPKHGMVYHKLRHNEIEDLYFNGLSAELVKVIKLMMEEDYTKRPTIDDLLQMDIISVKTRKPIIIS